MDWPVTSTGDAGGKARRKKGGREGKTEGGRARRTISNIMMFSTRS